MRNFLLFKKEYRLGFVLMLVFGIFLYNITQTSEQIIYHFTDRPFHYYKPAFFGMVYLVLLIVCLALLLILNRNDKISHAEKGNGYSAFIVWTALSFFPGWIIHLYFVLQTLKTQGSFMTLEREIWLYNCADITLIIGFSLSAFFVLKPLLYKES